MTRQDPEDAVAGMFENMLVREKDMLAQVESEVERMESELSEARLEALERQARIVVFTRELEHHKRHG